jgi:hypothetical protein
VTTTRPPADRASSASMAAFLHGLKTRRTRPFGPGDVKIEVLWIEGRESSEIGRLRVTTPRGVRHAFAKIFVPRKPGEAGQLEARAQFAREIEWASRTSEAFGDTSDLRSVRPVAWDARLLGVVTEEAPGTALDAVIESGARWPATRDRIAALEKTLAGVGRWLRIFQASLTEDEPVWLDPAVIREYIDTRLVKLTGLPHASFGQAERAAVLAQFDRHAADLTPSELRRVAAHGDMTPSNVLVAGDRLTVLDFAKADHDGRYLDVARLYTQLEFFTTKPQYRKSVFARLQQALLLGYDATLSADNPLFQIYAAQHVVCHYLSHARQPGRFPISLYSQHQCRHHRRWLRTWSTDRRAVPAVAVSAGEGR